MKFTHNRKSILLALIIIFAFISIVQTVSKNKSNMKQVNLSQEPDTICVIRNGGATEDDTITFVKTDGKWTWGKYTADESLVNRLKSAVSKIKVLGTASNSSSDASRYGLEENDVIKVQALADGKTLRSLVIGKDNATVTQCYAFIDGSSSISILNAALHSTFSFEKDEIRSKSIYSLESSKITGVRVTNKNATFALNKILNKEVAPDQNQWLIETGSDTKPGDASKITSFLNSISSLEASSWLSDDASASEKTPSTTVEITSENGKVTLSFYEASGDEEPTASSSETPYLFNVKTYAVNRYNKTAADFILEETASKESGVIQE